MTKSRFPAQIATALLTSCLCIAANAADRKNEIVIATPDFSVTTHDFYRYLETQGITPEKMDKALGAPGAVKNAFENIYVIRAFAAKGSANPEIDKEQLEWAVANFRERSLMNQQLELEINEGLASMDWDSLAKDEYKANKEKYLKQEQVSASHVLISIKDRTPEEAQAKADELYEQLKSGESFEDLAKKFSDDAGSGAKGGELGFFTRGQMVPPFEKAAFAMSEPGEISKPIETRFGYHIIRLNERKPERQLTFEEAKPSIMAPLKRRTEQSLRKDKIAAIKSGSVDLGLEVNVELLESIEKEYAPKGDKRP